MSSDSQVALGAAQSAAASATVAAQAAQEAVDIVATPNDATVAALVNSAGTSTRTAILPRVDDVPGTGKIQYRRPSGDPGTPDFKIASKRFNNGSGKPPNVATWMGFNPERYFQDGSGQTGLLGWHLGFEPGYQNPDDGSFGPEFYLNYTSPDGTTVDVAELRPLYVRLLGGDTNSYADKRSHILFDIGPAAGGIFAISPGSPMTSTPLFQVTKDAITMAATDVVAQGTLAVRPASGAAILRVDGSTAAIEMRVGAHAYGGGFAQSTVDALEVRDKVGEVAMVFNFGASTNQRVIGANGRMHVSSVIQAGAISGTPTLTPTSNLGTGAPAPTLLAGSNCVRGTVLMGTGTGPAAGDLVTLTLPTAFQSTPTVIGAPSNFATGAQPVYAKATSGTSITVGITGALVASQAAGFYAISYQVLG